MMKLSEAIRLGALLKEQGFGVTARSPKHSCALIAAKEAIGAPRHWLVSDYWPWVIRSIECPKCGEPNIAVSNLIVHLNDIHRWTRERIAEWVATIEPQERYTSAEQQAQEVQYAES